MFFNLNSRGNEKFELSSQGTYDLQSLGKEALFIADYEDVRPPSCILQKCVKQIY